ERLEEGMSPVHYNDDLAARPPLRIVKSCTGVAVVVFDFIRSPLLLRLNGGVSFFSGSRRDADPALRLYLGTLLHLWDVTGRDARASARDNINGGSSLLCGAR